MPRCRDATLLISEGLDRELSWWRRFGLRLHLLLCRGCARFARQLRFLTESVREFAAEQAPEGPALSGEARARIRSRIQEELD